MSDKLNPRDALVEGIDAWLPQTQCTQCGYPRCRAYAEALADGKAAINQCPPGDAVTIHALSRLLQLPARPLDARFGKHKPRVRAVIDETLCIGCRKCIDACPVDAILGAHKLMHTVLTQECTGCELCLPPCPVDCIALTPWDTTEPLVPWPEYGQAETSRWRARTDKRRQRLGRLKQGRRAKASMASPPDPGRERMRAEIRAAVERVKMKKRHGPY